MVFARRGEHERAREEFHTALLLDPEMVSAHFNRALSLVETEEEDEALEELAAALEIEPDHAPAWNLRAMIHFRRGDRPAAIAEHAHALEIDDDDPIAHNHLAWILATAPEADLRDGPRALKHATAACELTSWEVANHLDTYAAALAECGRFTEAAEWQLKAVELMDGQDTTTYSARLDLYRVRVPYREAG